jgi:hypothetical protein
MVETQLEKIGSIYREGRNVYLIINADDEAYFFAPGSFNQGLTRFADKGCKIKDIQALIPPETEAE